MYSMEVKLCGIEVKVSNYQEKFQLPSELGGEQTAH